MEPFYNAWFMHKLNGGYRPTFNFNFSSDPKKKDRLREPDGSDREYDQTDGYCTWNIVVIPLEN